MCCVFPTGFSRMASVQKSSSSTATSKNNDKPTKEMKALVESYAAAVKKKGIKLLALDFDKTLVEVHSRGYWTEDMEKLASHVRPCMRDLLVAATSKGLYTSIVTYSSQKGLIRDVLHNVLPKKVANAVYIVANTPEFLARHDPSSIDGKEVHIAETIAAIAKDHKVAVKDKEVLLMDDDLDNVRKAVSKGHYAFQVQKQVDYESFQSFETMLLL